MIGRTNCKRGGSGNVTTVTLVSGASGETVTATCTGKSTKTATTNASGVATFKNLDMGYNWTFTWSTFSKTEKIDQLTENITLGGVIASFRFESFSTGNIGVFYQSDDQSNGVTGATNGTTGNIVLIEGKTYIVGSTSPLLISQIGKSVHSEDYGSGNATVSLLYSGGIFGNAEYDGNDIVISAYLD